MPTYGYECKSCGHTFDVFQSMADEPLKTCPSCGKAIRRLINGGTGVIFKGGGFYVTDRSGSGAKAKNAAGTANGQGSGTDTPAPAKAGGESAPSPASASPAAPAPAVPKAVNS
ncbi:MAG: zinc ribbon domain-containing protein [Treponema sp.]|nr:zinc ribbon domain-containing protein [Treponema sp.]